MSDINQCFYSGRLAQDAKFGTFQSGDQYANFGIAVNRRIKDQSGEWIDKKPTTFIEIKVTGHQASRLNGRVRKGTPVFIQGRMELRQWTDQSGATQSRLECVATSVEVISLPERKGSPSSDEGSEPSDNQPVRQAMPRLPEPDEDEF